MAGFEKKKPVVKTLKNLLNPQPHKIHHNKKKHKTRVVVLLERQPVEVVREIFRETSPVTVKRTIQDIIDNKGDFLQKKSKLSQLNAHIARRWHRFYRTAGIPDPFWYLYSVERDGKIEPSIQLINLYYEGIPLYSEPKEFQEEIKYRIELEKNQPIPTIVELPARTQSELDEKTINLSIKRLQEFKKKHGRNPIEEEIQKMAQELYEQILNTQVIEREE